jgi:hypothetical protein
MVGLAEQVRRQAEGGKASAGINMSQIVNPEEGDTNLSRKPADWDGFFDLLEGEKLPAAFLRTRERKQASQERDPLEGLRD